MISITYLNPRIGRHDALAAAGIRILVHEARKIQRGLGTRNAAVFLRNQGVPIGHALQILARGR